MRCPFLGLHLQTTQKTNAALTVSANPLMSILIDHFGWFGITPHSITPHRAIGAIVLVTGVILVTSG